MPKKKKDTGGKESGATHEYERKAATATSKAPDMRERGAAAILWLRGLPIQDKSAIALILLSGILVAGAGAWFAQDPLAGAMHWIMKAVVQSTYILLLTLSVWRLLGRRNNLSFALCFGLAIAIVTIWTIASGIEDQRLRKEANDTIVTFRDTPLNIVGLADAVETNPYVAAYMVMREAHWDLQTRLNRRVDQYRAEYERYAEPVSFLAIERLRSRYELWRAYYQVQEVEKLLDRIAETPLETTDLIWTVNLLEVDARTRAAYKRDLEISIAAARIWQSNFIEREKQTLRRIRNALKVVIDAKGRYRFAEGQIVFEDPGDAAIFSGKEPELVKQSP